LPVAGLAVYTESARYGDGPEHGQSRVKTADTSTLRN